LVKSKKRKDKKILELLDGEGKRKKGPVMGVDVHKDVLAACIVSESRVLLETEFKNTKEGINKLISTCKKRKVKSVGMESTAQYHFKLMYGLADANVPFLVANPQQTKTTQGKKTDAIDAKRIAVAHRDGRLKPSVISPKEIMSLRKGMRALLKIIQDQTKIKQRLNQVFHQKDVKLGPVLKTKWGLQVLRRLFQEELTDLLDELLPKRKKEREFEKQLELFTKFKKSLDEIEQYNFGIDISRLYLLSILAEKQRIVYTVIARKNKEFLRQMRILLSIPGVGPDTAAIILAELVDVSYFKTPGKLAKWTGLAPRVYQSGHRKNITGKLHKGGNKFLRRACVLACQNIFAKGSVDNPIHAFMKAKKEGKGTYWLSLCAGARKLLTIIWYLLKSGSQWAVRTATKKIIQKVKVIARRKQKLLEGRLQKFKSLNEKLTREENTIINEMVQSMSMPDQILKVLLESV